jgi:hypothetical protein
MFLSKLRRNLLDLTLHGPLGLFLNLRYGLLGLLIFSSTFNGDV